MRKTLLTLLFLLTFSAAALAAPVTFPSYLGNGTTPPKTLTFAPNYNLAIPSEMVEYTVLKTDYITTGTFKMPYYFELKNPKTREAEILKLKDAIAKGTVTLTGQTSPDSLMYAGETCFFNMAAKQATVLERIYLDTNGHVIATSKTLSEKKSFGADGGRYGTIAKDIAGALDYAHSYLTPQK